MEILLIPENDRDMTVAELQELAAQIRSDAYESKQAVQVTVTSEEEFGSGLGWEEVLQMIVATPLPDFEFYRNALIGAAIDRAIDWLRARFRRPHERDRVRVLRVYSSAGELLREYRLESAEANPREKDQPND